MSKTESPVTITLDDVYSNILRKLCGKHQKYTEFTRELLDAELKRRKLNDSI